MVDVYFTYCHNQPYSFFHEATFRNNLAEGLLPEYLILAVLATSMRFSHSTPYADSWEIAAKAYSSKAWSLIIPQCFDENPHTDYRLVQAVTLLSVQDFVGQFAAHFKVQAPL